MGRLTTMRIQSACDRRFTDRANAQNAPRITPLANTPQVGCSYFATMAAGQDASSKSPT